MDGHRAPTGAYAGSNFLMTRITSYGKRHKIAGKWESVALEEEIFFMLVVMCLIVDVE